MMRNNKLILYKINILSQLSSFNCRLIIFSHELLKYI